MGHLNPNFKGSIEPLKLKDCGSIYKEMYVSALTEALRNNNFEEFKCAYRKGSPWDPVRLYNMVLRKVNTEGITDLNKDLISFVLFKLIDNLNCQSCNGSLVLSFPFTSKFELINMAPKEDICWHEMLCLNCASIIVPVCEICMVIGNH